MSDVSEFEDQYQGIFCTILQEWELNVKIENNEISTQYSFWISSVLDRLTVVELDQEVDSSLGWNPVDPIYWGDG